MPQSLFSFKRASKLTEVSHLSLTFLVMIFTTPPKASDPYKVLIGPFITSILSILEIGGKKEFEISLKPLGPISPPIP